MRRSPCRAYVHTTTDEIIRFSVVSSKRIANLGLDLEEIPSAKQLQLQKFIRVYASQYLHENMLTLQNLPSEDEYNKLKQQRDREIQMRLAMERRAAMEAREREAREQLRKSSSGDKLPSSPKPDSSQVVKDSGWIPYESPARPTESADDPMVQQMNIIRDYIRQARQAQKYDEVRMLEDNLRELQQEYYHQKRVSEASAPVT